MRVLIIINSYYGKQGAVGIRAAKIVQHNKRDKFGVICRGDAINSRSVCECIYEIGSVIFKLFKLVKVSLPYFATDIRVLESHFFELLVLDLLQKKPELLDVDVVHLWEYCPKIIEIFKARKIPVIQDIAILSAKAIRQLKTNSYFRQCAALENKQEKCFQRADMLTVPSDFVFQSLSNELQNKSVLVNFGVDVSSGLSEISKLPSVSRGSEFCFLGNVSLRKGFAEILRVFSRDDFKNLTINIYGRYRYITFLRLWVFGPRNVKLKGFQKLSNIGSQNFCLFLPSWIEGSSKAVFEGMAMGLAVVVTPNTGSIVKHGVNGLIVEPGDEKAMAEVLLKLHSDREYAGRLSESAVKTVQRYGWDSYCKGVRSAYRQASQATTG